MQFNKICRDVELFLRGLKLDLPEIFPAPRQYRPAPVRSRRASELSPAARRNARNIILARVKHWAAVMNVEYNRVAVKDQRTLWGSCSGRKNLNFNWRLAAAPPEALDYVVIHELCHLREMNHSKNFWALVRLACPDYSVRRKWLKENYAALRHPDTAALLQPGPEAPAGE